MLIDTIIEHGFSLTSKLIKINVKCNHNQKGSLPQKTYIFFKLLIPETQINDSGAKP